ncbi:D-isomer specific 2-hydroxyacid dehydrogenase, catalytic domain [Popillia japonica]|uniref:Glyoxylate reductase/hydroxypyruvate reductase n=1 Tax=Popillia japonica TaxID=7064 RepID=A0AAW1KIS9_POPJA
MSRPKVYVTRKINAEALNLLKKDCEVISWTESSPVPREELLKNVSDVDALFCVITDKIDKELLDKAKKLKVLSTMSVGYDHLEIDEIKSRNIKVGYTPNILTDATAELTVALLLATSRRLLHANHAARTGDWTAWAPFWMCGQGLTGSTVGIVGFGRIGQEIGKRLKPFKVKRILYQNRSAKDQQAQEIGAERVSFDELLKESDFVIVTIALAPETAKMFNEDAFRKMKPTSVFINTSRGDVVDQDALIKALQNKTIWAAGLDVMTPEPLPLSSPLFKLDNCVILPHIGSATTDTRENMTLLTAKNIIAGLKNEKMPEELVL